MLGEAGQAVIPNFTSSSTPNPNPNSLPPHSAASSYPHSLGFGGLESCPAFELNGVAASQSQMISQTTDSTTYGHHVVNNEVVTRQLKIIQPVQCEVCNIICNTGDVLEKHKLGKKHLKNLQKQAIAPIMAPPVASADFVSELENKKHKLLQNGASVNTLIHCDICNVICNNQDVYAKHLAGKKHSAKAIIKHANTNGLFNATSDSTSVAQPINGGSLKPNTLQPVRCELCNISCTSNELLNMHISGKKHQKKLQELESTEGKVGNSNEGKSSWCELCGISCDTYDVLRIHLSGKKHLKNLEKSQKPIGPNPASAATEPAATSGIIGPMQTSQIEEVTDGSNKRKAKKVASLEDVETKKQKILQGGGAADALRTCTVCNVVCNSPTVYISHLAGQKHAAMAVKQAEAETGSTGHKT